MIQTKFFGHACLRFGGARGSLICDPWLSTIPIYGNTAVKYPFLPDDQLAEALDVTHIYISHHHEDHFHAPTLDLYSRDITVLIPAFEYSDHPRAASMRRSLNQLGFHNVIPLRSWEIISLDLGDTLTLTLIPSAKSRWHDWENSGLILDTKDWTAVNLNDNLVDRGLLTELQSRTGPLDAVFVQGFPSTEFPGNFDFSVTEKIRIGRQKRGKVDQAEMVIRHLAPRSVVPIACDIAWHRSQDQYRNYSDKPTPSRFGPILRGHGLLSGTELIELSPGDSIDLSTLAVRRPYGILNYAGFRRRLRRKMMRYDELVAVYDAYTDRRGFDPQALTGMLRELREFFPRLFPIDAQVRIDFVIVDADGAPLSRIAFAVRGFEFSISNDDTAGVDCDQEIIVPESVWLETLGGRLLRRDLFALCLNRQLKPFRPEVAGLRYFISYYFDFGDISPWVRISGRTTSAGNLDAMRRMRQVLAPHFPAQDLRDEYCLEVSSP